MRRKGFSLTFWLISICYLMPFHSSGQTEQLNLMRYWYYRDRLKYFVVPGQKMGESEVAGTRNNMMGVAPDFYNIDFGQHGCYFGYYLGILATEYELLTMNNQDAAAYCDLQEASWALNQFLHYMDECEGLFGDCSNVHPNYCDTWDGFFIRNCVPAEFIDPTEGLGFTGSDKWHHILLNQDLSPNDQYSDGHFGTFPPGHPGYLNYLNFNGKPDILNCVYDQSSKPVDGKENMSQDEAIGILLGLALVYQYIPDLASTAGSLAHRIIEHISHGDAWVIVDPNGNAVADGAYAIDYSFGFCLAGQYFGYNPYSYTNPGFLCLNFQAKRNVWDGIGLTGYVSEINCSMECTLAAIGNSWGIYLGPCSTTPLESTTMSAIINKCQTSYSAHNETFYCLLLNRLHPTHTVSDEILRIAFAQLSSAPDEGPYFYDRSHYAFHGWATSYRWHNDTVTLSGMGPENDQTKGNFSGMDYMLLYNMYVLTSGYPDITGYYPRTNVRLSANLPIKFGTNCIGDIFNPQCMVACGHIESNAKIRSKVEFNFDQNELAPESQINSPGKVSYIAKSINLMPGFQVEKNAEFHSKLVPVVLWDDSYKFNTSFYSHYGLVDPTYFGCWFDYPFYPYFDGKKSSGNNTLLPDTNIDTSRSHNIIKLSTQGGLKIVPNPANNFVSFELNAGSFEKGEVIIQDIYGHTCIQEKMLSNTKSINIKDLAPGLYIVNINTFEKVYTGKLIKE
jgi:hypothetical protein